MKLLLLLLSVSSLYPFLLQAKEIAGINIPDTISFSDQSTKLKLNGAGIRTKFIFDIYVGSLYLETKQNSAKGVYEAQGEKELACTFFMMK